MCAWRRGAEPTHRNRPLAARPRVRTRDSIASAFVILQNEGMAGTYKLIEIVGTSPMSFAEAVKSAIAEASKTIRHLDWFEVVEQRGSIAEGKVQDFQVTLKVGFKIEH